MVRLISIAAALFHDCSSQHLSCCCLKPNPAPLQILIASLALLSTTVLVRTHPSLSTYDSEQSSSQPKVAKMFQCSNQPRGCRGRCNSVGGKCPDCSSLRLRHQQRPVHNQSKLAQPVNYQRSLSSTQTHPVQRQI